MPLDKIIHCAESADDDEREFFDCATLVSHTFHQIVLPYKFRSLTFRFPDRLRNNLNWRSHTIPIPVPNFCEAIHAGDAHALHLVPLVQELTLLQWSGKGGSLQFSQARTIRKNHKQRLLFPKPHKTENENLRYLPRHHGTIWQTCTTPVVAHVLLPRQAIWGNGIIWCSLQFTILAHTQMR